MQEKTLEEEFKGRFGSYWSKIGDNAYIVDPINNGRPIILSQESVISFISSRVEKAREEGRKEGMLAQGVSAVSHVHEEVRKEAITQYKEELLGKIRLNCALYDSKDTNEVNIPVIRYTRLKDIIES